MKKRYLFLLGILILLIIFTLSYDFLDSQVEKFLAEEEAIFVKRIIDGDTFETSEGETIRLLGINTPERGEKYYSEAKEFLEILVLNESVMLEFVGVKEDKYYRTLAYVFLGGENVNVEMIKNGFGNYYFYSGRDKYSEDLENAWETCLENKINFCEPSSNSCSSCLLFEENSLRNSCSFSCDLNGWEVKGEGRDKIIFSEILGPNEEISFDLDLTYSGGSLFLRDNEGKLVYWEN